MNLHFSIVFVFVLVFVFEVGQSGLSQLGNGLGLSSADGATLLESKPHITAFIVSAHNTVLCICT